MAGQIPNQSGSHLPGLTQPNRNALPQTPNLGGVPRSTINMDPAFLRARPIMQEKIYDILLQWQQHPVTEVHKRRFKDFAKRLEEAMLTTATSQEEYLNLETLESRLRNCIEQRSMNNRNQQHPQHVSSSAIGLSNGYQPSSSSFPIGSRGTMSSMDAQRIASQIRTLRITDSNNSYMNVESSENSSNEEGSA